MLDIVALILCILSSLFLIVFILLHSGKGSGLSDMFGGSTSLSGGTALERRLDRITVATATIFALSVIWLSWQWKEPGARPAVGRILGARRSGGTW